MILRTLVSTLSLFITLMAGAAEVGDVLTLSERTVLLEAQDGEPIPKTGIIPVNSQVRIESTEVVNDRVRVAVKINGNFVYGYMYVRHIDNFDTSVPPGTPREKPGQLASSPRAAVVETTQITLLSDSPEFTTQSNFVTDALPVGAKLIVLDSESDPELIKVQLRYKNGSTQNGWLPRSHVSEVPINSSERIGPDGNRPDPIQARPDNEYCHNRTFSTPELKASRPRGTIKEGAPLLRLQTLINGEQQNCPDLGYFKAGSPFRVLGEDGNGWVKVRFYSEDRGYIVGWLKKKYLDIPEGQTSEADCDNCSNEIRDNEDLRATTRPAGQLGRDSGYQSDRYLGWRRANLDVQKPWCDDHKSKMRSRRSMPLHKLTKSKRDKILASGIDRNAFDNAYNYYKNNPGVIKNSNFITIIDFSKRSNQKRYHVIDMRTGDTRSFYTQHGSGSDPYQTGLATRFGNGNNSARTSLGISLTGLPFKPCDYSKEPEKCDDSNIEGQRLSLHGQQVGSNDNNCGRSLHTHQDSDKNFHPSNAYWRSLGCPALPKSDWAAVKRDIMGGSVFYMHN